MMMMTPDHDLMTTDDTDLGEVRCVTSQRGDRSVTVLSLSIVSPLPSHQLGVSLEPGSGQGKAED